MKSWRTLCLMGGVAWWAMLGASAQAPQTGVPPPTGGAEFRTAAQGAVEQVMKRIKQRNPEEFERLNKLRQEDPEAFRKALKDRLDKAHWGGRAGSNKVVATVAPGERDQGQGVQHARNPGGNDGARRNAELNKCEQDIRALAESYKRASPDEQKMLQADLKKKISETFELREKLRQEAIQRVEAQLTKLKKEATLGKAKREAVVESRFKELTEVPLQATR